jgi:predicted lactoylglutathione lyase
MITNADPHGALYFHHAAGRHPHSCRMICWRHLCRQREIPMTQPAPDRPTGVPANASYITLGVRDFSAMREFYRRLGWPLAFAEEDFVAFQLRGAVLALFPVDKLAADGNTAPAATQPGLRFAIGVLVDRPEQVDQAIQVVRQAGGQITKEPIDAEFFEGRSAYFADPEGNYWEVAWAPPTNQIVAASRNATEPGDHGSPIDSPTS